MSVERYFSVETGITFNSIAIEKLLNRIDMIGSFSRTAVSKSMPVKPIAASPHTLMPSFAGLAGLAGLAPLGVAGPGAELRGLAPADVGERRRAAPERRELVAGATGVVRDDGVRNIHGVQQVPDDAIGRE